MSFTENDRIFRSKKGKSFHGEGDHDAAPLVGAIAAALKVDFGAAPASVKQIARLTGSNERAVRNWLDGKNGPSSENLVALMQHSDAVFQIVLALSHRNRLAAALRLANLRENLLTAIAAIDAIEPRPT